MKISFDYDDLDNESAFAAKLPTRLRVRVWRAVREVSFTVERWVKIAMPVDTGRARASWGHSTPPAGIADGVWIENESKLSIEQGSTLVYIGSLNEGHSSQAPAGFIDAIAARAQAELDGQIDQILTEEF